MEEAEIGDYEWKSGQDVRGVTVKKGKLREGTPEVFNGNSTLMLGQFLGPRCLGENLGGWQRIATARVKTDENYKTFIVLGRDKWCLGPARNDRL